MRVYQPVPVAEGNARFPLFTVLDDDRHNYLEISAIHNEEGYREIRNRLSSQYNLSNLEPNIQIWNVDLRGDRSLTCAIFRITAHRWIKDAKKCSSMYTGCGVLM
jgi:spore cortex formation protein SpoVR/YcgB (stage V sporulation)